MVWWRVTVDVPDTDSHPRTSAPPDRWTLAWSSNPEDDFDVAECGLIVESDTEDDAIDFALAAVRSQGFGAAPRRVLACPVGDLNVREDPPSAGVREPRAPRPSSSAPAVHRGLI